MFFLLLLFCELVWFVFLFLFFIEVFVLNCLLSFNFFILKDNTFGGIVLGVWVDDVFIFFDCFDCFIFVDCFCICYFWVILLEFLDCCCNIFLIFLFVDVLFKMSLGEFFCIIGFNGVVGLLIIFIGVCGEGVNIGLLFLKWG